MVRESLDEFVAPLASFFRNYGTTGITAGSAMSGDSPVKNWGGAGVVDFPGRRRAGRRQLQREDGEEVRLLALPARLRRGELRLGRARVEGPRAHRQARR